MANRLKISDEGEGMVRVHVVVAGSDDASAVISRSELAELVGPADQPADPAAGDQPADAGTDQPADAGTTDPAAADSPDAAPADPAAEQTPADQPADDGEKTGPVEGEK